MPGHRDWNADAAAGSQAAGPAPTEPAGRLCRVLTPADSESQPAADRLKTRRQLKATVTIAVESVAT